MHHISADVNSMLDWIKNYLSMFSLKQPVELYRSLCFKQISYELSNKCLECILLMNGCNLVSLGIVNARLKAIAIVVVLNKANFSEQFSSLI